MFVRKLTGFALVLSLGALPAPGFDSSIAADTPPSDDDNVGEMEWDDPLPDTDSDSALRLTPQSETELWPDEGVATSSQASEVPDRETNEWFGSSCSPSPDGASICFEPTADDTDAIAEYLAAHGAAAAQQRSAQNSATDDSNYQPIPQECLDEALDNGGAADIAHRFSACRIGSGTVTLRNANQTVVGELTVMAYGYAYTMRDERTWAYQLELSVVNASGAAAAGVTARFTRSCGGTACTNAGKNAPAQPLAVGQDARAESYWKWKPAGPKTQGFGLGEWLDTMRAPGYGTSGPQAFPIEEVRCDNMIGGSRAGCVFPAATPDISYFTLSYPQFTTHLMNAWGSGLPGHLGSGTPLHRTQDQAVADANRATACPPRSAGGPIRPSGYSCDEYPFASTVEGAASSPLGGRTFDGCQYPGLPTGVSSPSGWSGCMILKYENSAAGSVLGSTRYKRYRVIEGDPFYVEVTWPV